MISVGRTCRTAMMFGSRALRGVRSLVKRADLSVEVLAMMLFSFWAAISVILLRLPTSTAAQAEMYCQWCLVNGHRHSACWIPNGHSMSFCLRKTLLLLGSIVSMLHYPLCVRCQLGSGLSAVLDRPERRLGQVGVEGTLPT